METALAALASGNSFLVQCSLPGCRLHHKCRQPGTRRRRVFAAAFHNTDPNIILLGQDVGGIDKSTDGGLTWRYFNSEGFARPELTLNVFVLDQLLANPTDNDTTGQRSCGNDERGIDISPPGRHGRMDHSIHPV
jgi:hypothetical protein